MRISDRQIAKIKYRNLKELHFDVRKLGYHERSIVNQFRKNLTPEVSTSFCQSAIANYLFLKVLEDFAVRI